MLREPVKLLLNLGRLALVEMQHARSSSSNKRSYYHYEKSSSPPSEGEHYYSNGWGYNNSTRWRK